MKRRRQRQIKKDKRKKCNASLLQSDSNKKEEDKDEKKENNEDEIKYKENIEFVDAIYKRLGITNDKNNKNKREIHNNPSNKSLISQFQIPQELIQCIVCMNMTQKSNIAKLLCSHNIICIPCYKKWIKIKHECPLCRSSIYSEAVLNYNYPLYFPNYNPY